MEGKNNVIDDPTGDIRSGLEKQIKDMGFKDAIVIIDRPDSKQRIVAKVYNKDGDWLTYHGIGDDYEAARAKLIEAVEHKISVPY